MRSPCANFVIPELAIRKEGAAGILAAIGFRQKLDHQSRHLAVESGNGSQLT